MNIAEIVFRAAELIGVAAFALSGALTAIDRNLDLFGVVFLGITTALGGGTIRDILLGRLPPAMFTSYEYLALAAAVSLLSFALVRAFTQRYVASREQIERIINVFDAAGLSAFAVSGVQAAMAAGYADNAFLCLFLGMTTGVGGGVLRDMLSGQTPFVMHKRVYATAALLGSASFYLPYRLGAGSLVSVLAGMGVTLAIRILATRYRWSLPKAIRTGKNGK